MIRVLSQNMINQIAAGEVIERPASVIKELVENSIDAGSTEIQVSVQNAGKSLISVSDNGCGMDKDSLKLCILNHATSKLPDGNLFDIHTFGFRGEALPSMVSIARVTITSSDNENGEAWKLNTEGKENFEIEPESRAKGTTVTVKDLFFATPARLKFLKSDTTENDSCQQALKQLALAFRHITFTLYDNDKKKYHFEATTDLKTRIQEIFGKEFSENLFEVKIEKNGYSLYGFIGVPTFNKPSSHFQYFFVNNRFVKDKIFSLALRSAYSGLIPPRRYPVAILFLDMPNDAVDVNAHPAKVEVRFREAEIVRSFLISSLRKFISEVGASIPTTEIANEMYKQKNPGLIDDDIPDFNTKKESNPSFSSSNPSSSSSNSRFSSSSYSSYGNKSRNPSNNTYFLDNYRDNSPRQSLLNLRPTSTTSTIPSQVSEISSPEPPIEPFQEFDVPAEIESTSSEETKSKIYLGNAIYQIANTYIVAAAC